VISVELEEGEGMTKHRAKALYRACSPSQAYQAWLGFFLNCALVLWCAAWLTLIAGNEAPAWPWLVALLPLGLFLADLFSGLVHWATDTWLDETQWCRVVCIAREHHIYPHHIVDYGVRDYLGYSGWPTALLVGPVAILLTLALQPSLPAYAAAVGHSHSTGEADDMKRNCSAGLKAIKAEKISLG